MKAAATRLFTTALVATALALAGCGGPTLVGSWGSSDGSTLALNADNTFRTEKTSSDPALAGCALRVVIAGRYTSVGNALTLNSTTLGSGRSGCTNESDNLAYAEDSGPSATLPPVNYTYTLSGTQLTLTGSDGTSTTYTMR